MYEMFINIATKFRTVLMVICAIQFILSLFSILQILKNHQYYVESVSASSDDPICSVSIVQSIIDGLDYPKPERNKSIYLTLSNFIDNTESSIDIVSYYWSLNDDNFTELSTQGRNIFQKLVSAAKDRNVTIKIVENKARKEYEDTRLLSNMGLAEVRRLNVTELLGAGILHTKMFIFDRKHILLGSANMDWKAFTQRMEVNVAIYNCDSLASDAIKLFQVYWYLSEENSTVPDQWPPEFSPQYNIDSPFNVEQNGNVAHIYMASSPPAFCPEGRTPDLRAILDIINSAEKHISVCMSEYAPLILYTERLRFWPVLDDALRKAAIENGVEVRLLAGYKNGSKTDVISEHYLRSLSQISSTDPSVKMEVRIFIVSDKDLPHVPEAQNLHSKFMVTDKAAWIGTSNWSGDYFVNSTAGASVIIKEEGNNETSHVNYLSNIFDHHWNSPYAQTIS